MKSILSIALICLLSLTIPANAEESLSQTGARKALGADEAKSSNQQSAISNLELVSVGVDEAVITWQTPTPMICQLEYGPQRQLSAQVKETSPERQLSYQIKESDPTKYHYRIIGSLKQNQEYEFRILDQNGTPTRTEYFKTLKKPAGKYLFSFAAAADLHCSPNRASKKGMLFSVSGDILRELVTEIKGRAVDFTILKGDITHTGSEAEFEFVKSELVKLKPRVYAVIGNHDIMGQAWQSSFSQISGQLTRYYSFNLKGWHFIILDSSKGSIDKHQLDWLKRDLDKYKTSPTMVFLHHWVNRTSVMDDLADMGNKFSTIIGSRFIDNHAQLRAILESYPQVVSVHSGHAHANLVTQDRGITYIATAASIQYPVSYNVYRVWEGGYTMSTYLLPDRLEDAAKSKTEIIAQGNQKFANFAIPLGETITRLLWGNLSDRSFTIEVKQEGK